jgi:kynureninase
MAAASAATAPSEPAAVLSFAEPTDLVDRLVWKPAASGAFAEDGEGLTAAYADKADSEDELRELRSKFFFPPTEDGSKHRADGSPAVYLCGNSLGLQPKAVREKLDEELTAWSTYGVEGHFKAKLPWVTVDETPIDSMARIVGAKPVEVAVMNTLTVNLHLMMVPFYRPTSERHKIIIEKHAFPSDWQAVASQIRHHGFDVATSMVEIAPRDGEETLRTEDVLAVIEREGPSTALVLLSGIQYYTGQLFEIPVITAAAQKQGCKVGWDLAHAAGNAPLFLHEWGPDFACWCTYKYINSGPGSIGGCFVHERHAEDASLNRFAGWWGHRKSDRFAMRSAFDASPGAFGFQLSNPPVLCVAALRASLELFDEATMPRLRRKSLALTAYLEQLLLQRLPQVKIMTPKESSHRGAQLSLEFPSTTPLKAVYDLLQRESVIVDIREPSAMRVAPAPLYNSFRDCFDFVDCLAKVMEEAGTTK